MPRYFFGITTNLGWRIMGNRLHDAIVQRGLLAQHTFEPFTLPSGLGRITWSANYSEGEQVLLPLLDPHRSFHLASRRLRQHAAGFDAVIAATSPMAAAFVADATSPPVFQIVDGTRDLFRRDFGITNISDRAIQREREHFNSVRHTFALSSWVRDNIVDIYGVPAERVSVIRPMAPCSVKGRSPRKRLESERLRVCFIGGDFLRKGGDRLLAWQREHLHDIVDLHVVTESRFHDESVPNTRWYGSLNNHAIVNELLPNMDVLCHPTTRDCSAIVVAEAAAAGVPSVTTTVGGIPDLVDHERSGLLFESNDDDGFVKALTDLAQNPVRLSSMKELALKKAVDEFAADRVFAEIVSQVQESLAC